MNEFNADMLARAAEIVREKVRIRPLLLQELAERAARNTPQSQASKNCGTDKERDAMDPEELRERLFFAQLAIDCLDDTVAKYEADAKLGALVRKKLASGNEVPVERCTVTAAEVEELHG